MRSASHTRKVRILFEKMPEDLLPKRTALPVPEIEVQSLVPRDRPGDINGAMPLNTSSATTIASDMDWTWEDEWTWDDI
jgi:hypothetical protein